MFPRPPRPLTAGSDSSYGSGGSPPIPGDPLKPLDASAARIDPVPGDSASSDAGAIEAPRASSEQGLASRPSKAFRGWNAAYEREAGSSLGQRVRGWFGGLFGRSKQNFVFEADTGTESTQSGEFGAPEAFKRPSFDDEMNSSWAALKGNDSTARRPGERPSVELFEAPWDGSYDSEPSVVEPESTRPFSGGTKADPVWDEPRTADLSSAPPEALAKNDVESVWSPRAKDGRTSGDRAASVARRKQGFLSRLFGGKAAEPPQGLAELEKAIASGWLSSTDAPVVNEPAARQPATEDFSHSVHDSLDVDSAEDAEAEVEVEFEDADDSDLDALIDVVTGSVKPEPEAEQPPIVAPKRDSIISRLFKAKPKVEDAEEPGPRPADLDALDTSHDPHADELIDDSAPVANVAKPALPGLHAQTTQPFPAFRDARDDFPPLPEPSVVPGRITASVSKPVLEDGEKTDEFAAVPPPVRAAPGGDAPGFFGKLLGMTQSAMTGDLALQQAPARPALQTLFEESTGKSPFVLAKFRTFYNEVIRDKHQKSDVISGFATAIVSAAAADLADPEFAAQLLSKRLSEMLELQAAESNWTGGDAARYYPEAQYAMAALADETFSTIEWPGRPSWHKYALEPKMFGTRGADVEFFKRVDRLLRDPNPPKGARDLARLYLLVIASGFRGKFRLPNLRRPLAEYRRRLYEFSHGADPLELYARDRKIFPDAANNTLASRAVGRFTSAQKWVGALVILVVLYFGISHYAWVKLSADLKDVMSRIESTSTQAGGTP